MVQHAYICAKVFLQLFGHGGFSAAGTARYSDHHSIHKIFSPPVFSYSIIFRQASQRLGPDFLCETAKNSRLPGGGYGTMRIEKKLKRKGEIVYVYTP